MQNWIRRSVKRISKKLIQIIQNWDGDLTSIQQAPPYHSLSPINDADVAHYITALQWALDNRKKESIYNIALTGPYGSGKSSILKTFQKKNSNPDFVFLEISLATFKEELDLGDGKETSDENGDNNKNGNIETGSSRENKKKVKSEDILRLIELSILQQIFYHEEDKQIPDSRFKKIKSFKRRNLVWITAGIMTVLLFGLNLFFPKKIEGILEIEFSTAVSSILHWLSLFVFLFSLAIVIFRSIRLIYSIKVSKFKFHEAEIEIDKSISKSILNNHLDEILYFFEVTKYSVVLIEDLDRFRQAEIFTKLRELNLLINNSKKVKQEVVFIYAVRDELFTNKERSKFFDFIIPVIPVINSSNSNEKLAKIISDNQYNISGDLVEDIALFIDDMRLLYNITNEYHIYHELLAKELDQNKLLAMIVYKNMYPEDFVLLSNGEGKLYKLLTSRQQHVNELVKKLDAKIERNKKDISNIETHQVRDEVELRMIYLLAYVNKIGEFSKFIIQGSEKSLTEISENESLFAYFIDDQVRYRYFLNQHSNYYYSHEQKSSIKFSNLEREVDPDRSYEERIDLITAYVQDRIELLKQDVQRFEKEKSTVRHLKLKQILSDKTARIEFDTSNRQGLLLRLLLRTGYIDEDYLDYISLFYEGSITKDDRTFLLSVKSQSPLDFDFKLNKIGNLVGKIRLIDFHEPYLLNYNMLDFLLISQAHRVQLGALMEQLNDQQENQLLFIEGFLNAGTNLDIFVKELIAKWPCVWKYIDTVSTLTKEVKEEFFKLVIVNADIQALKDDAELSTLRSKIVNRSDFLTVIPDQQRIKDVIAGTAIKFKQLELKDAPSTLVDLVVSGNYYVLSVSMIERIMSCVGKYNSVAFETANYKSIMDSKCKELISYVNQYINEYIQNVYLQLSGNVNEPEDALLSLLNNDTIEIVSLRKIIKTSQTKLSKLDGLIGDRIVDDLFINSKIKPDWSNVISFFMLKEQVITDTLVTFLNVAENAQLLAEETIDTDNPYPNLDTVEKFMVALLNENRIDDDLYHRLATSVPYVYDVTHFEDLGYAKMKMLVVDFTIGTNSENFKELKKNYSGLERPLLEGTKENVLDYLSEYEFDADDIDYLLVSSEYTSIEKNKILNGIDPSVITNSGKVLRKVTAFVFEDVSFQITKPVLMAALHYSLSVEMRVKLFNMNFKRFDMAEVQSIFKTFPYPYSDIGVRFTSPIIPYDAENYYLANNLKNGNFIVRTKEEKKGIRLINFKK